MTHKLKSFKESYKQVWEMLFKTQMGKEQDNQLCSAMKTSLSQCLNKNRCSMDFRVWEMLNLTPLILQYPPSPQREEIDSLPPGTIMAHGTFLHLSMWHAHASRSYKLCKVWEVLRTLHIWLTISLTLLIYQERLNVITHFLSKSIY